MSAAAERAADEWWLSLEPERRTRIHRWLTKESPAPEVEGQYEIPIHDLPEGDDTVWPRSSSAPTTFAPH
ncbi:hypothetical protein P9990_17710 [Prescottella equi]|uniref:hypothetical protein n=1 Tax=Rhodococcus hoagii TaxID=43767 RepID=UPI002575ED05|nr:hypothetical protein [Prescottella equi]WJJ10409.1 hypothetical protein P9990_17710 [Prescottella equi]